MVKLHFRPPQPRINSGLYKNKTSKKENRTTRQTTTGTNDIMDKLNGIFEKQKQNESKILNDPNKKIIL